MCCSVLQCVAVCCSVLQCVAVRCSVFLRLLHVFRNQVLNVLRGVGNVLQCVTMCYGVLQCVAVCFCASSVCYRIRFLMVCSVLRCVAVCCSVLQCVAVCCSVLQCVAVPPPYITAPGS